MIYLPQIALLENIHCNIIIILITLENSTLQIFVFVVFIPINSVFIRLCSLIFFFLLLSLNFDRELSDVRHINILLNNLNNINKC